MKEIFSRCELFWGSDFQETLAKKHILIVGLGGVGAFACEALARIGIGQFTLVDFDVVTESNINRQLFALNSTIGQKKTLLAKKRCEDINSNIKINIIDNFYTQKSNEELFQIKPDFVVDAIDTLRSKIELLEYCYQNKIPIISSLGAGNRIIPEALKISDLRDIQAKKCVFTKNILYQLNKRSIREGIPFVISDEPPAKVKKVQITERVGDIEYEKITPASVSFVPPVAGYIMAGHIIRSFLNE